MNNNILQRQNEESFLSYLAAADELYGEEKKWTTIWVIAVTVVGVIGTGIFAVTAAFSALNTWISILVLVGEFAVLSFFVKRRHEAAKIQELGDCELLQLEWNKALASKPKSETIEAAKERFLKQKKQAGWDQKKHWYTSAIASFPLYRARLICQKENIWWDSGLRRKYASIVIGVIVLVFILFVTTGIIAKWTLQDFFQGPVQLALPVFVVGLKHVYDHWKAAQRLGELRDHVDSLLDEAAQDSADPAVMTQRSRDLQNEIFHHRSENPPIFDWFYNVFREKNEKLSGSLTH